MGDRWLEALQKMEHAAPAPSKPSADPLLSAMFGITDDDVLIAPEKMDKVHDDGSADVFDPVAQFLSKLMQGAGRFPESAQPLAKSALTKDAPMQIFMRLSKIDEEKRLVYGVATSEVPDRENEVCNYEGSKPLFEKWSASVRADSHGKSAGNLREMHTLSAVGKLEQIQFNDAAKQIEICAKVVDDNAWKKVKAGVYSGFSVGGRYAKTWQVGKLTHYIADPVEVSLVDRPCVPNATFELVKLDGEIEICKFEDKGEPMSSTVLKKFFEGEAEHHEEMKKAHRKALAACSEGTSQEAFHKAAMEQHAVRGAACADCADDFEKSEKADLAKVADAVTLSVLEDAVRATFLKMFGNSLVPTTVSGIAPPRPIVRPGQPEIKTTVPSEHAEMSKALGLDPSEWHSEETTLR